MLKYMKWFYQFWKEHKLGMIGVFILTVLSIAIKTAFPILLKHIIDLFGTNYEPKSMIHLVIIFTMVAILHELIVRGLPLFRGAMNMIFAAMVRNKYYTIFTENNHTFFKKFRTGDLLTRLTDDVDGNWDRIAWYSCSGILRPVEAILILSFTLSVMANYSWELTLYSFIPIPFLVIILSKLEDRMVRYTDEKQKAVSDCNNVLEACFSGIRVIKTTLSENDQISKYKEVLEERVLKEKKFLKINQIVHFFSMFVNHAGKVIVLFIGSYYVVIDKISVGTLLLFVIYLERLVEPIWTLGFFYASSKQVFRYVDRIAETEDSVKFNFNNSGVKFTRFDSLKVSNLEYIFEDGVNGVKDINFALNRGDTLAVVGSIGSGKTTLLLFSDKILNNILLGDQFSDSEINDALVNSLVSEEVDKFPQKLETMLGQRGVSVSGGQKQRLSLARALIRTPELLFMDDVTAAMDAGTEMAFWKKFRSRFPETTSIIVTHREATAKQADSILVLKNGKGVEYGTHKELDREGTLYHEIMNS